MIEAGVRTGDGNETWAFKTQESYWDKTTSSIPLMAVLHSNLRKQIWSLLISSWWGDTVWTQISLCGCLGLVLCCEFNKITHGSTRALCPGLQPHGFLTSSLLCFACFSVVISWFLDIVRHKVLWIFSLKVTPSLLIHMPEHPIPSWILLMPKGIIWDSNGYGSCAQAVWLLQKRQCSFLIF